MLDLKRHPHRRRNPLTGEWVLVSPHRTLRPWQGQVERTPQASQPRYDSACYLCPGNGRAGGAVNPDYASTFVFDNDFAALLPGTPREKQGEDGLLVAEGAPGVCRVVCFSPRHDLTVSRMGLPDVTRVVDVWVEQSLELGQLPFIAYVQIFENRGEMMGASNPHPHCQIWACSSLPNEVAVEQSRQKDYQESRGTCLLCDYLAVERRTDERLVCENESFAAIVPFWAVWPFEIIVIPARHVGSLDEMGESERRDLADILKRVTTRYDHVFDVPFPYTMGFHQKPAGSAAHPEWHFHAHFYPPLLRSATVKKFMVGFEMLAMPQRDNTAEGAAERLRGMPEVHF